MDRQQTADQERVQVVFRLSKDVLKRVDHIGIEWDTYRTETVERMLSIAADQLLKEQGPFQLQGAH